jgi:two-component system, cell cycle response regulator DivK
MSKRILVVDDQEDLRGMLRDLLSGTGYTVIEAENGERGVASAKSEQPDLILMDIQMPVLDGYEAARRIKADPALKPIPIVAVSSFAMKGDEEKARAPGRAQSREAQFDHLVGASEQGWRKRKALCFRGIENNYQLVLVFGACAGTSARFSPLSPRPRWPG